MANYDRMKGESQERFNAFTIYRDLGPSKRSHTSVSEELACNVNLIHRWSTEGNWVQRVLTWDDHLDKIQQTTLEEEARSQAGRIVGLGVGYLKAFHARLEKQLDAEAKDQDFEGGIPLNAQGFVAVSRLIVELSGVLDPGGASGVSEDEVKQRARVLTAQDLVQATLELSGSSGKEVDAKEAVVYALSNKFGRERLGLPAIKDAEFSEAKTDEGQKT